MLNKITNWFISDQLKKDTMTYIYAKNIVYIALISIIFIPQYALIYYFYHYPQGSYLLLITGVFFFSSIIIMKYEGSLFAAREIIICSLFGCIFWISFHTRGLLSPAAIWLVLPPLLAILFGSTKSGVNWVIVGILGFFFLFLMEYFQFHEPLDPISDEISLSAISRCGLIGVIFVLAYFYEYGKREAVSKLQIEKEKSNYLVEKLEEALRIKIEFLENMSHEFRTPVNGIIGFAQLIENGKLPAEYNVEFSQNILSCSKDLLNMIDDLLNFTQTNKTEIKFFPTSVDLCQSINESIEMNGNLISEKNLDIRVNVDPVVNNLYIDHSKLKIILSNYISNAIKFTPNDGRVEIRAFPSSITEFCIEVEDTGIGIDKDDINKIFTPLTQLDMSITKKYQGIGIGLALTLRLVEAQNGRVGVKSEKGKGSIFYFILPCQSKDYVRFK